MEEQELVFVAAVPEVEESPSAPDEEGGLGNAAAKPKPKDHEGGRRLLREILETIVLTVVLFAVINTVTGRFRVEGPSMKPNLHEGQYLIISKMLYKFQPPRRGDIIVFHHPKNPSRDLIKRIVGLPGETIEIRQGRVYVNGALLEEPYVLHWGRYSSRYVLGPDEFYVLGDNRPNSDDSHNWGVLSRGRIVGKAWISYWPPGEWGGIPHSSYPSIPAARGQGLDTGTRTANNAREQRYP